MMQKSKREELERIFDRAKDELNRALARALSEKKHELSTAYYADTHRGLIAVFVCLCGKEFGCTGSWAESGAEFDGHLELNSDE